LVEDVVPVDAVMSVSFPTESHVKRAQRSGIYTRFFIVRVALWLLSLCTPVAVAAGVPAGEIRGAVSVGKHERTYIAHVPSRGSDQRPFPLVLVLHGRTGTGAGAMRLTHMDLVADRHGFVAVFPDGLDRSWADGRGTPADRQGVDDVAFVSALVDHLSKTLPVDSRRVFACGISNGGFMAARLGCELSPQIAAIGVVAATFGAATAASCRPSRAVSAMIIHGTDDPLVPASGGRTRGAEGAILSVDESVQRWAQLDGCGSPPTISDVPGRASDGTRTRREIHAGCRGGAEVDLLRIEGGGHTWPGGDQYLPAAIIGVTSRSFDAGEVLWEFFSRHPLE